MEEPTISDPLIWREEKTEKVLIGKILSSKSYTRSAIERILQKAWNLQSGLDVIEVTGNAFLFNFSEEEELNRILQGRPWSINGFLLNLMERPKYKQCEDFDFSRCPIWIQIHNVPMEAMCLENAIRIGGYVEEVMLVENPHHNGRFVRNFMRVRVVIDLRKSLASGFWLDKPYGDKFWIDIRFEKLQKFCYSCGKIGHDSRTCRSEKQMSVVNITEPRFGAWITTNQCRILDELIVIVKDSWSEAAYFRRKQEENAIRRRKKSEQKIIECAINDEDDLFFIRTNPSLRQGVLRESKFQEGGRGMPNVAGGGEPSHLANLSGSGKNRDVKSAEKEKHIENPEVSSAAQLVSPTATMPQSTGEEQEYHLAIVPYNEGPLIEVINGFRGLGLKRGAGEDLETPSTKRRKLVVTDSECCIKEISVYAGNLRKTKTRLRRQ
ncbi:hypothetical protein K1719_025050 [Acacia pycnantha]|nr:hypothetical protein K1719_025050 [Acacia pycnantha]